MIILKSTAEIEKIKVSCQMVTETLNYLKTLVKPGITTIVLNEQAEIFIKGRGAIPAFKGYQLRNAPYAYPSALCTSINKEVIHGIPSERKLNNGDILSLDLGILYNGYYGDAAITIPVGDISNSNKDLLSITHKSLELAIEQCHIGNRIGDISNAIESYVTKFDLSVVREFGGHGIGSSLHEEPYIPNYGKPGLGQRLIEGMVIAIEPMINRGISRIGLLEDGWTIVTVDNKSSAHFEHTVAITSNGPEVLTNIRSL